MVAILVENDSSDFIYFKSDYGVAHIVGPGGKIELGPAEYKAAVLALPKDAGQDLYPESPSSKEVYHEITVTNVGSKTLVFQAYPVLLPPVIIKHGQTEALHYVRYKVFTESK